MTFLSERSDINLNSEERPDHGEYATLAEVIEAIHALSATEYKKLTLIAGFFWKQRNLENYALQPEDLLSEAVVRTLTEERRWRKAQVSLIKHLDRTMESISSHWLERGVQYEGPLPIGPNARASRFALTKGWLGTVESSVRITGGSPTDSGVNAGLPTTMSGLVGLASESEPKSSATSRSLREG